MKKIISLALAVLAVATFAVAGGGNILASGEIELAASATATTNTQSVALYNITGKEWAQVHAIIVQNNSDFVTTTTVARVDLGDTTTLATATAASNATAYTAAYGVTSAGVGTNLVYTHTVPPCAKELLITVKQPTNDAASTLEWVVYGE